MAKLLYSSAPATIGWVAYTIETYFLTVLESKIKTVASWGCGENPRPGCRQLPPCCVLMWPFLCVDHSPLL